MTDRPMTEDEIALARAFKETAFPEKARKHTAPLAVIIAEVAEGQKPMIDEARAKALYDIGRDYFHKMPEPGRDAFTRMKEQRSKHHGATA